jgi:hypothetical protein
MDPLLNSWARWPKDIPVQTPAENAMGRWPELFRAHFESDAEFAQREQEHIAYWERRWRQSHGEFTPPGEPDPTSVPDAPDPAPKPPRPLAWLRTRLPPRKPFLIASVLALSIVFLFTVRKSRVNSMHSRIHYTRAAP